MRTYTVNQTVRKYTLDFNGIRWRNTAMGETLTTLQEMADALPGFLYDFDLIDNHPDMGVNVGSLLVFKDGEGGTNHLAVANDTLWVKVNGEYKNVWAKSTSEEITVTDWKDIEFNGEGNYVLTDISTSLNRPTIFDTPQEGASYKYNCILTGLEDQTALLFRGHKKYVWDLKADTFSEMASGGSGTGSSDTYTNLTPVPTAVGGIPKNATFNAKTMQEMWDALLYPDTPPSVTDPGYTLTNSWGKTFAEVGAEIDITFGNVFSPGYINPLWVYNETTKLWAATANVPRVGTSPDAPQGSELGTPSYYPIETTPVGLLVDTDRYKIAFGSNTFQRTATFAEGPQPRTSKGNIYKEPYPEGTLTASVTIMGVYPIYATTINVTSVLGKKQALQNHHSEIVVDMAAEVGGKQKIWIPNRVTIGGTIYQLWNINYLYLRNMSDTAWEKADMLLNFGTPTEETINGVVYKVYTNLYPSPTDSLGARKVCFTENLK